MLTVPRLLVARLLHVWLHPPTSILGCCVFLLVRYLILVSAVAQLSTAPIRSLASLAIWVCHLAVLPIGIPLQILCLLPLLPGLTSKGLPRLVAVVDSLFVMAQLGLRRASIARVPGNHVRASRSFCLGYGYCHGPQGCFAILNCVARRNSTTTWLTLLSFSFCYSYHLLAVLQSNMSVFEKQLL